MRLLAILLAAALASLPGAARAANAGNPQLQGLGIVGPDGVNPVVRLGPTTPLTGDPWTVPQSLMLGGQADLFSYSQTIRCLPYGSYDLGTCLSVVATDRPLAGSRAGVGPDGLGGTAAYPAIDSVAFFDEATSTPPMISVCNSSTACPNAVSTPTFTAGRVSFSVPLSTAQVAMLRRNMWIITNSVESSCPAQGSGPLPMCSYVGQITSWDPAGSFINVQGWLVPGGGNASATQVPPAAYDTHRTNLGIPAAFIGAATSTFARNTMVYIDPNFQPSSPNATLGNVNTQVFGGQGDEIDLVNNDTVGGLPGRVSLYGMTIGYNAPNAGTNNVHPAGDSFMEYLYGGGPAYGMPQVLKIAGAYKDGCLICGDLFWVGGGDTPANTIGAVQLGMDLSQNLDSDHNWHLRSYLQKFATGTDGLTDASLHFGLNIDAAIGALGGTPEGEIVFNRQGYYGGASVVGYNGTGMNVDDNGNAFFDSGLLFKGHIYEQAYGAGPTVSSCGSGTVMSPGSSDNRFVVSVNGSTSSCQINFAQSFSSSTLSDPVCTLTVQNSATFAYIISANATTLNVGTGAPLAAGTYIHGICRD